MYLSVRQLSFLHTHISMYLSIKSEMLSSSSSGKPFFFNKDLHGSNSDTYHLLCLITSKSYLILLNLSCFVDKGTVGIPTSHVS